MSNVLAELQAEYDARAQTALNSPAEALESSARPKATRTYSPEALERRKAWGRFWGGMNAEHARKLRAGEISGA